MAVPTGISPGINPATPSPVSWNLPDFNFSDPLGKALSGISNIYDDQRGSIASGRHQMYQTLSGLSEPEWTGHTEYVVDTRNNPSGVSPYGEGGYHWNTGADLGERYARAGKSPARLNILGPAWQVYDEVTDWWKDPSAYTAHSGLEGTGPFGVLAPFSQALEDASWNIRGANAAYKEAGGKSIWQRAMDRLIPASWGAEQQRTPHFRAPQDDFSGVQWRIPDIVKPPSEFDFSTEDFRTPPVPSAPSAIHPRSGVPPQTPQVAGDEEEVSEERVVEIKKKPREKRTSVEEQVVVASAVKKALDNAAKGKKVKNEFRAITELAKTDPTIARRYTTPGSQDLIDITSQVESFASINKPRPGYGKPPRRPGGR